MARSYTNIERYNNYNENQYYMMHRYITDNNEHKKEIVKYTPSFFEKDPNGKYTDLVTNEPMAKLTYSSMQEADWARRKRWTQPLELQTLMIELIDNLS